MGAKKKTSVGLLVFNSSMPHILLYPNSSKRDYLTRWIWFSRPKFWACHFFNKFFRCFNDFIKQHVYFTRSLRVYIGLNNVSNVYLVQVSLLPIGQQGLGHFFRCRSLLPIGWRTLQIVRQRRRKMINTAPS